MKGPVYIRGAIQSNSFVMYWFSAMVHKSNPRRWSIGLVLLLLAALVFVAFVNLKSDIPVETLRLRYGQPPSRFTNVGRLSVHYRDEGAGPALVLLHGTGASLHTWEGWTSILRPDLRVIRMDLPGFGLTGPEPSDDYTSTAYVRFLEDFVTKLGIERFDLAGNSLGGFVAWRYAVVHPERVRKLILVDAAGYPSKHPPVLVFRLARISWLASLLERVDPRALVARTLRDAYADKSKVTPELVDLYRDLVLRTGNRRAFSARVSTSESDHSFELRSITAPTLIMWGALDALIPVSDAKRFENDIPKSQLVIYEGVGHAPMEEISARSAADVREFLSADPGSGR